MSISAMWLSASVSNERTSPTSVVANTILPAPTKVIFGIHRRRAGRVLKLSHPPASAGSFGRKQVRTPAAVGPRAAALNRDRRSRAESSLPLGVGSLVFTGASLDEFDGAVLAPAVLTDHLHVGDHVDGIDVELAQSSVLPQEGSVELTVDADGEAVTKEAQSITSTAA
jgi:hypothetical protein